MAAVASGLDPVGVVVISFVTALGGGVMRDLLIGATPPAAIRDGAYAVLVLIAAAATWLLYPTVRAMPGWLLVILDAAGLALFAVAGTQKSLDHHIPAIPAIFLGAISGAGGGTLRDVLLNQVPHVLRVDIYASAAMVAAAVVVLGRRWGWAPTATAIGGWATCFFLRLLAVANGWQLPVG